MRVYASAEMTLTDTNDGISVTGIDRYYMASSSSSGITVDSPGWKPDPQETNPISRYHWSYEEVNYSSGPPVPSKPAIIGVYGKDGVAGKDGVGISNTDITYAKSTSGTVKPTTGYTPIIPKVDSGQFLWTKTVWTYTDKTTETGFSVAKMGETGAKGADSGTLAIITPEGNVFRDTTASIKLESKLFIGGKEVTASAYKWYYSDGNKQVTHATTQTATFKSELVKNSLPIFLDATYKGTTYTSSVTLNDISDVYTSIILGVATFKNGKGSNTYTVKLYRNGEEIDPGGSIYSYEWEKLNSQGVKDTKFTKTGKTITINASEIDNTNLFNCYIYTK